MYDVVIIGAGTAGLTSSIYSNRGGLSTLIIENNMYGGQIVTSHRIENYPSLANISGFEFVQNLYEQAVSLGAILSYENITNFNFNSKVKTITTDKNTYETKSVIIATGSVYRKINCQNEAEFDGKGVSYCATCDGAFYKNKEVCILGGGNTALDEAMFLSHICKKVYLIHRRDVFRADKKTIDNVKSTKNIEILTNYTAQSVDGEKLVSSITLKSTVDESIKKIDISGVFVAIGRIPQTDIFKDVIDLDQSGYIISDESCKTKIPGIFVAGDVRTKSLRQLVTATSDGAVAATNAIEYIL